MVTAYNRYLEGHGFGSRWGLREFFSEYFDLRTLLHYLHFIQVTNSFITHVSNGETKLLLLEVIHDHISLHGVRMPGGGTTESSGSQPAPSPSPANSNERISQLKPPGGLDFDSTDLSQEWKRWSEEIIAYIRIWRWLEKTTRLKSTVIP